MPTTTTQEAVMGQAIPTQHPAVVLRSHYVQLRALLAVAMIAVVGLAAGVVILAVSDDDPAATVVRAVSATPPTQAISDGRADAFRYDGGPEEGTRGLSAPAPVGRPDGGPEEGSAAIRRESTLTPGQRYDGGPDEGSRGAGH